MLAHMHVHFRFSLDIGDHLGALRILISTCFALDRTNSIFECYLGEMVSVFLLLNFLPSSLSLSSSDSRSIHEKRRLGEV